MKIAGFGVACLDRIALTGAPDNNRSAVISRYTEQPGGLTANALLAAARLGADVRFTGALGEDPAGRQILSMLRSEGVDADLAELVPGRESYFSWILIDEDTAERHIYCKRDTVKQEDLRILPEAVEDAEVFLTDSHFPAAAAAYARIAYEAGIPTVGDYKLSPENAELLLRYTEYPIVSEDYALSLAPDGRIETALEVMAGSNDRCVPVITCGARGCVYYHEGRAERVPAFQVPAVDTAAAGDVFHGGFARAIGAGCCVRAALVFASAVSAIKCTRFGGSAGAPSLEEVRLFLAKHNLVEGVIC
ncbi:MAG: sugar kinase [Abditibacteriota bacterium]|nr:sugar kinase [Abditibacteriota bacterium]